MITVQQERPVAASPYRFEAEVTSGLARVAAQHHDLTLTSVFQPIFSLSHMRAVGYEALLRAHDSLDRPVSPLDVLGEAARHGEATQVERLAQALHLENFSRFGAQREWLFLNVAPGVLTDPFQAAALFANLKRLSISPRRVVLEVIEQRAEDLERLAEAVRGLREQGFLIALDDFGAGHSNLERIWQLNPDIVKLDRIMLSHAQHRTGVTAVLHGLVTLLHEAGKLVLIEGIETEHEAQIALSCEADFVQGYFFGRPAPGLPDGAVACACIGELTERFREQTEARERRDTQRLAPYLRAFERAAERLAAGEPLDEVCWNFLALDHAARCFLLDERGRQAGRNVMLRADRASHETRFLPLADAQGANWLRRPYFRSAIAKPGRVHVTRPYLSINEALPCVTLSAAIRVDDALCVLCGDIDWIDDPDFPAAARAAC
ncbi:sensor domain-containing phosphodiesterase [Burkholderia sp. TSV86]|uniref:sensor domain-containing phosphodiesterase n=1 Tax=Burkholderia sp. TSV86 TaxID=1385594 RepID=UPI00075F4937|nr:EAL domain-containing protein [Burkholderia sp. TSV86]KVE33236.1 diguanylate phosphodiesterase [Burkholderia sp. TSV86]